MLVRKEALRISSLHLSSTHTLSHCIPSFSETYLPYSIAFMHIPSAVSHFPASNRALYISQT